MFGKNYDYPKAQGTDALRTYIRSYVISGDPATENKMVSYHINWKFYKNQHWAENNDKLLSFNYVRSFIDKVNNFLAGKTGFEVNVADIYGEEVPPETEKLLESRTNYLWARNNKGLTVQNLLQMGGICGDVYVFLSPLVDKKYIKIDILDTRNIIPMFSNGDFTKVLGYKVIKPLLLNDKEYVQEVTEYTLNKVVKYFKKDTDIKADRFEYTESANTLGFIPIVHIENIPMSDSYGGVSDMQDILKINKIYNELAEDVKEVIDYYAQPTTVITGATVGQLKRGINQIWSGLPSDASVFNLSLGDDLALSINFLQVLKTSMFEFANIPENTLGKSQGISNTSAAALNIVYHPLIECADKKWLTYGEGIEKINAMLLLMYKLAFPNEEFAKPLSEKPEFYDQFRAMPVFKYGLPSDRLLMLQEADIELRNKIASRAEIMERLGKKNIPLLEGQIASDTALATKAAGDLAKASVPEYPAPVQ